LPIDSEDAAMAMFRRRAKSSSQDPEELTTSDLPGAAEGDGTDEETQPQGPVGFDRSAGPFDEAEADLADQDLPRIDLGSLRIPGLPSLGVQVEADQNSGEIHAVTAIGEEAAVQLQPFAAPRSEGIWDELRAEMLAEISGAADARVTEAEGAFGPELRAIIPARTPDGQQIRQALRFAGIDGPRWFLRVMFLGKAAVEPDADDELHRLIRQTIVVRGSEAMAPRDPLPLRLPDTPPAGMEAVGEDGEVVEEPGADDSADADAEASRYAGLDPFERGPEITEVR
jgi:Protein of unknown function (DUF3710)